MDESRDCSACRRARSRTHRICVRESQSSSDSCAPVSSAQYSSRNINEYSTINNTYIWTGKQSSEYNEGSQTLWEVEVIVVANKAGWEEYEHETFKTEMERAPH
eukprot:1706836-Pyramimonas_sp.AAC.1